MYQNGQITGHSITMREGRGEMLYEQKSTIKQVV